MSEISNEVLEERLKVNSSRIDGLERKVEDLIDFKYTVNALSNTVNDLKTTVDKLVSQDGDNYRAIKKQAISTIISLALGAIFGAIVGKLF